MYAVLLVPVLLTSRVCEVLASADQRNVTGPTEDRGSRLRGLWLQHMKDRLKAKGERCTEITFFWPQAHFPYFESFLFWLHV